jgi:hypothetical protein
MVIAWHNLAQWAFLSAGIALVGCGGQAKSESGDQGEAVECEYEGETYKPGDDFPASDGCNTCTCGDDGSVACTLVDCHPTRCDYGGSSYELFEMFPAGDGCNMCICHETGVTCGTAPCERCDTIENEYASLSEAAKRCSPDIDIEQCTVSVSIGLACACPSFVNPANADAIEELESVSAEYRDSDCSTGVVCGQCLVPERGMCSPAGVCVDVFPQ